MMLLLIIGAVYWRAKLQQVEGREGPLSSTLSLISFLQLPSLALTLIGLAAVAFAWAQPEHFSNGRERWVATFAAVMALLEYINYYHRQLQHFDHLPDFKRLLAGKGLRPSQLAKDLRAHRRT